MNNFMIPFITLLSAHDFFQALGEIYKIIKYYLKFN